MIKVAHLIIPAFLLSVYGCVSNKKYQSSQDELSRTKAGLEMQLARVSALQARVERSHEDSLRMAKDIRECLEDREVLSRNIGVINKALAEQGSAIRQIYQKVDGALVQFEEEGVDVKYRNGMVHVSIANDLMFTSGYRSVSPEGKDVLKVLADAVRDFKRVTLFVIGNIDQEPKSKSAKDSWVISTERANMVVRVLQNENNIEAKRVFSAGRATTHPLVEPGTAQPSLSSNKPRIEIILNPDLERLWEFTGVRQSTF